MPPSPPEWIGRAGMEVGKKFEDVVRMTERGLSDAGGLSDVMDVRAVGA